MRTQTSNGAENAPAPDKKSDDSKARITKLKAEAYDLIRSMEAHKLRLGEVNQSIARLEQEK